jgi:hypothetical protein
MIEASGHPIVEFAHFGGVHVSFDGCDTYVRFGSVTAFRDALEDIDRQLQAHDTEAFARFGVDREAYWQRMAELRAEIDAIGQPDFSQTAEHG